MYSTNTGVTLWPAAPRWTYTQNTTHTALVRTALAPEQPNPSAPRREPAIPAESAIGSGGYPAPSPPAWGRPVDARLPHPPDARHQSPRNRGKNGNRI